MAAAPGEGGAYQHDHRGQGHQSIRRGSRYAAAPAPGPQQTVPAITAVLAGPAVTRSPEAAAAARSRGAVAAIAAAAATTTTASDKNASGITTLGAVAAEAALHAGAAAATTTSAFAGERSAVIAAHAAASPFDCVPASAAGAAGGDRRASRGPNVGVPCSGGIVLRQAASACAAATRSTREGERLGCKGAKQVNTARVARDELTIEAGVWSELDGADKVQRS
jgi:hypothetical protein